MYDLKCKRQGCEYNKNCNCTAKNVEMKKDTSCKTFKPSNKHINEEEKIGQPPIRKDINIKCKAKCIFNSEGICSANGITVLTFISETGLKTPNCCTFQPE